MVLGLAALLAALPARAQNNPAPRPPPAAPDSAAIKYDLQIDDGQLVLPNNKGRQEPTLAKIIQLLRASHSDVNIVIAPELADVRVQDLKLHGAEISEELEALRVASGGMFSVRDATFTNGSSLPLFALEPSQRLYGQSPQSEVEVFNLTRYFQRLSAAKNVSDAQFAPVRDEAINSIQQTVDETADSLHLKNRGLHVHFHSGASLLVLTGSREALNVGAKVIHAIIDEDLWNAPFGAEAPFGKVAQLEAMAKGLTKHEDLANVTPDVQALEARIVLLEAQLAALTNQLAATRAGKPGAAPPTPAPRY